VQEVVVSDELKPEIQVKIDRYVSRWLSSRLTAIGVVNLVALLGGLAYVFFWLPEIVADKVVATNTKVSERVVEVLTEAGVAQVRVQDASERIAQLSAGFAELDAQYRSVQQLANGLENLQEASQLVDQLVAELVSADREFASIVAGEVENRIRRVVAAGWVPATGGGTVATSGVVSNVQPVPGPPAGDYVFTFTPGFAYSSKRYATIITPAQGAGVRIPRVVSTGSDLRVEIQDIAGNVIDADFYFALVEIK
jgi:hypothetical protein